MQYKVSAINWLCVREDANSKWIPVFQLTEEQSKEMSRFVKSRSKNNRNSDVRDSLTRSVDVINGAVRIGQGTKMHPAIKSAQYGLLICCRCPGTQQGTAYHKAQFFAGMASNCRN
jgi:hypothetical protein